MVYIKKLVLHGFKSFARKTEIPFDQGINVVLGPNGSGKSNISDALCFVLGRLSIKSMRAAKSANLLFMGSPFVKPSREASVSIVFDNTDRAFALESDEVSIERVVRRGGQGAYRINGENKTRGEIIEMLAQAGIDPYGFNLILQGQIQSIVRMHPDERRKIIEEVAGISIYESRKEKSLKELDKSDERLKEVSATLRERTAFLKNLDRERAQALKFKELEENAKKCKASIVQKKRDEKIKELNNLIKSIDEKTTHKEKVKIKVEHVQREIEKRSGEINDINKNIQKSTGIEQETLHNAVANLRAEIEGLKVRKENYENRRREIEKRIVEMQKSVPEMEAEIEELKKKSPLMAKKTQELKKKKDELSLIEDERKKALTFKTELNSLRERMKDKERQIGRATAQGETLLKQIEENSVKLIYKTDGECSNVIISLRQSMAAQKNEIDALSKKEIEFEKAISVAESDIQRVEKIKADVGKIDLCPLCQSTITEEHITHVFADADSKIASAGAVIGNSTKELGEIKGLRQNIFNAIKTLENTLMSAEKELGAHRIIKEKTEQLKSAVEEEKSIKAELNAFEERRKSLEQKTVDVSSIEERYHAKILEIEEISSRTEDDVDNTILYKGRELEKIRGIIKQSAIDVKELGENSGEISESLALKSQDLEEKESQERDLNERFKKMFEKRDNLQREIQEFSSQLSEVQQEVRGIEDQVNYLKIGKAKFDAEKEAYDMEMTEYEGIELVQGSINHLEERLMKTQESLREIGSINMRALEVYEDVKKEYDIVQDKVNTLEAEKLEILKIIEEIDKKKMREFNRTFRAISDLFSENFAKLYTKGVAFLEMENKEDIFNGGVNIVVKLAKGKYFDVTSLSGGEQTLVALSLLFAIQEHKPYHFYIFDEIDAALDKRNSERLAALLNQYMKSGQYIVITHNDAIILNSDILYGVSMHDGVSKVLSLKIDNETKRISPLKADEVREERIISADDNDGERPDDMIKQEMEKYVQKNPEIQNVGLDTLQKEVKNSEN